MKKKYYIFISIVLLITIYFIFFYKKVDSYDEIININQEYDTLEDIKKKGYIDLTEIQEKENIDVKNFLQSFKANVEAELKVITKDKNDKIMLTFFDIHTGYKVIRAHSRPYDKQSLDLIGYSDFKIEKNKDIYEVYLKDTYYPTPMAGKEKGYFGWDLLYRYKEE